MGYLAVAMQVLQVVGAVKGFMDQNKAAKQTKRANEAMMAAAAEESRLLKEDAGIRAKKELQAAAAARSQQVAQFLKSGVTLDGSPMLLLDDTKARGQENADNIIANADSQSRSMMMRAEANKQPVQRADLFSTGASILGSADKGISAGKTAGYW